MMLFLSPTITQNTPLPPPHSSILLHKATKKAPRVISVPLMSGVLRCSNVAFSALLRITLQPFALHSKRVVLHSKRKQCYIQKRAVVHSLASY